MTESRLVAAQDWGGRDGDMAMTANEYSVSFEGEEMF